MTDSTTDPLIAVVATFTVKPGMRDAAIGALEPLLAATHEESGCRHYALHQDTSNEDALVLIESWASQADLDAHFTQPHMAGFGPLAKTYLDGPVDIQFLQGVPLGDPVKGRL